jgi:hypothetical protein
MDSALAERVQATQPEHVANWQTPAAVWPARATATYVTDRLHPGVFQVFAGTYGAMLALLWLLFGTTAEAAIVLGVCTAYFAVYFGVPWAMSRLAGKVDPQPAPGSLGQFLRGQLEIYTGRVSGIGVLVQMLVVPVGFVFAFACFGIIIRITG